MAALTLQIGVGRSIAPGQRVCGDLEIVHRFDDGRGALVALIDGLGHGELAAASARLAADVILRRPQEPLEHLLARCHTALRGTRGVVLSIASIDLGRAVLSWLGVGNVTGVVCRGAAQVEACDRLLARAGLLGAGDLPALHPAVIPLRARDTLIFATDGINPNFADQLAVGVSPQDMADDIITRHCPGNDDGVVVAARVVLAESAS